MKDYGEYWKNHVQPALDFFPKYFLITYPLKLLLNAFLGYLLVTTIELNDENVFLVTNITLFVSLFVANFSALLYFNGRSINGSSLLIKDLSKTNTTAFALTLKCGADLTLKMIILSLALQFLLLAFGLLIYDLSSFLAGIMSLFCGWLWSILFPSSFLKTRVEFRVLSREEKR